MKPHNCDLQINPNIAVDNNPVHEAVMFYWGARCPDHEEGCPVCEAWEQYDNMTDNQKEQSKPSAEDWIILRLIIVRVGPDRFTLQSHSDASKAIDYLFKKLGDKTMNEMIDQLTEEPI